MLTGTEIQTCSDFRGPGIDDLINGESRHRWRCHDCNQSGPLEVDGAVCRHQLEQHEQTAEHQAKELRCLVSVRIDHDAWANAAETKAGTDGLLGWALVIAGESIMEGKRSGPVFLGSDDGLHSPHVGTWECY